VSAIRILERSVAERIAAGEVVERPASVVKELVENSLDAGATSIAVEVEGAGLHLIRMMDDGEGIAAGDVPLAFQRFATSKIARLEDLEGVRSYGFRGEALPSIAAVARVTLTTRTADAATATRALVTGGTLEHLEAHGAPRGTTVEVSTLFFNTPARLKFLKSPAREQALIADVVQRTAMAAPQVAFRLTFDGREAARWPRATAGQRVADVLNAGRLDELVPLTASVPSGTVRGWLARPERSRPARAGQCLFVNDRPIQSAMLRRAVEQGYAQLVPVGRFPVFALFLDVLDHLGKTYPFVFETAPESVPGGLGERACHRASWRRATLARIRSQTPGRGSRRPSVLVDSEHPAHRGDIDPGDQHPLAARPRSCDDLGAAHPEALGDEAAHGPIGAAPLGGSHGAHPQRPVVNPSQGITRCPRHDPDLDDHAIGVA